jgi:hypothetical protein
MTQRDITGTDAQGGRSGPRADQILHAPLTPGGLAPALVQRLREAKDDEDTAPVVAVDDLGAAVEGDSDRAVDDTEGKRHIKDDPSRTL